MISGELDSSVILVICREIDLVVLCCVNGFVTPARKGLVRSRMAGALDTYPRRDLAEYFLNIPIYFQLYISKKKYSVN